MVATCYALVCKPNGKAYVGLTRGKLAKRMREHRCLLRARKHTSKMLEADWHQFGEGAFECVLLESTDDESLGNRRTIEQKWLDHFSSMGLLYNAYDVSFQVPDHIWTKGVANAHLKPGDRWSPEVNEKRRLAQLGKPKGHGAKISATKQAKKRDEIVCSAGNK